MSARRTNLLAALLLVASCCAAVAFARLQAERASAIAAKQQLTQCRGDLEAIASARGPGSIAPVAPNQPQLEGILNEAAQAAGTRLTSIESGQPDRAPGGDFVETPIFLRLDALSLQQLVTFLSKLTDRDAACGAKLIELSTPQGAESTPDAWAADVTIGYRSAAPKNR